MERSHPVTAAMYFLSVILITAIVQGPVFMAEALVCSAVFAFLLNGKTAARTLFVMLPMALLAAVINLLFSNRGITVLAKLPSGNSITRNAYFFAVYRRYDNIARYVVYRT